MTKDGKKTSESVIKRNCETRDTFIERKGKDKFLELAKRDEHWGKLVEKPIPKRYFWIWKHFLQIWQGAQRDVMGNVNFSFETINAYVECFKVPFSIIDKRLLFKIKAWACNQIAEMKEK